MGEKSLKTIVLFTLAFTFQVTKNNITKNLRCFKDTNVSIIEYSIVDNKVLSIIESLHYNIIAANKNSM